MILPTEPVVFGVKFAKLLNEEEILLESVEAGLIIRNNNIGHNFAFQILIPSSQIKDFDPKFKLRLGSLTLLKALYGLSSPELEMKMLEDGQLYLKNGRREIPLHVTAPDTSHLYEAFPVEKLIMVDGALATPISMASKLLIPEFAAIEKLEPAEIDLESHENGALTFDYDFNTGKSKTTFDASDIKMDKPKIAKSRVQCDPFLFLKEALVFSPNVEVFLFDKKPVVFRLENKGVIFVYMIAPLIAT